MYRGTLYTKEGSYPQRKPKRLRLPNGYTRTSEGITHQHMLDAGYAVAPDYPNPTDPNAPADTWPVYDWDPNTSNWVLKYE